MEIFEGNCKALGIPIVELPAAKLASLYTKIEQDPTIEFRLDLNKKTLSFKDESWPIHMDESKRQSLLDGSWDAVAMLESNQDKVSHLVSGLAYMNFKK